MDWLCESKLVRWHAVHEPMRARAENRWLVSYLALCLGVAWALGLYGLRSGIRLDVAADSRGQILAAIIMLTPAFSASYVRYRAKRANAALPEAGVVLAGAAPYIAVWLVVPVLVVSSLALATVFGGAHLVPLASLGAGRLALLLASAASINLVVTSLFTFGEEYGWTGLLLPLLLQRGWTPLRAALGYGAIWGIWHWPLIWAGHNYPHHPWLGSVAMVALCMASALNQTALRLRSGSVFVTSFAHACLNSWSNVALRLFSDVDPLRVGPTGVLGIALLTASGLWLLVRPARNMLSTPGTARTAPN